MEWADEIGSGPAAWSYVPVQSSSCSLRVFYRTLAEMGTILILNHLIFSDFDFKSSEISMILILKSIQNQNHFMISYYN